MRYRITFIAVLTGLLVSACNSGSDDSYVPAPGEYVSPYDSDNQPEGFDPYDDGYEDPFNDPGSDYEPAS